MRLVVAEVAGMTGVERVGVGATGFLSSLKVVPIVMQFISWSERKVVSIVWEPGVVMMASVFLESKMLVAMCTMVVPTALFRGTT
jgi:hypothetical protein